MSQHRRASDRRPPRTRRILFIVALAVFVVLGGLLYQRSGDREEPRDGAPSWSPDGSRIVFAAEVGQDPSDLYVMRRDGSGRERLTSTPFRESNPSFSPDGREVAFDSDRDGNSEIYVMTLENARVRRLTNDPANDTSPSWSPDGTRIVFTSDRDQRAAADVYTASAADGSDLQRLTDDQSNWAPQFSRDGRFLALQINQDVFVMDLATRGLRRLTTAPANGMNPTWSPDGQRLAFVSTRNRIAEIFVMHADGSNQEVLVSMPGRWLLDPRWSPDGAFVAFVLLPDQPPPGQPAERQAIYTIELETRKVERISR